MKYINSKNFKLENTIVAFGKFDGVHEGHKKLIDKMMSLKNDRLKTVIFSFDKLPKEFIEKTEERTILSGHEKKIYHEKLGIDVYIEYPFDELFAETTAEEFIEEIIYKKLKSKIVVCGTDFRFGKNRKGDTKLLEEKSNEYGFEVVVLSKEKYKDEEISSSLIREYLKLGDIEVVNEMLGYNYFIAGKVIHGKALGRKLGFPTMNINAEKGKLLPPDGVYATKSFIDEREYESITNIGTKGQIINQQSQYENGNSEEKIIETFILNGKENVYGRIVEIQFFKFIRKEIRFKNVEELKKEIFSNVEEVKEYFENKKRYN